MSKEELYAENKTLKQLNRLLQQDVEGKDFIIAKLSKMLFGATSERFIPTAPAEQLSLFGQTITPDPPVEKQTISYQRDKPKKKSKARQPLPPDLPRIVITIEPEEDTSGLVRLEDEVTEILDIIPPVFQVIQIRRSVYVNPLAKSQQVNKPFLIAPLPDRVINKGIPSTRLLAYLLISKFVNHLPYYRQIEMFKRVDVDISASTINGWITKVCELIKPLYDAFCAYQFDKPYLQADETTLKILKVKKTGKQKGKNGKAHTGYYWVYFDPVDNHVVYVFEPGRGRVYPAEHLKNFSGKLQTDGLKVYTAFDDLDHIVLFACMAHIRRNFVDAKNNDPVRAEKVLLFIQALYAIEEKARKENYTPAQRLALRQEKAAPIMKRLKTYIDELYNSKEVLPKSAMGQAVAHALGRWKYMERYLEDGLIEIDNNLVENAIRPVALGRKNYLFAGSEQGAKWGAMIYTLLSSTMRNGHEPLAYLSDVLRRLPTTKISQLPELFPCNWKPNPPSELDLI